MPGPDIWGPHGWKFIHYITLGYPSKPTEEDKIKYYNFFTDLGNVIPCSICANHYKQHLKITPLNDQALKNTESLIAWAITMHNHVNARNGKKIYSLKDAVKAIIENDDGCVVLEDDREPNPKYKKEINKKETFNDKNDTNYTIILSISIIINISFVLYLVFKKKSL